MADAVNLDELNDDDFLAALTSEDAVIEQLEDTEVGSDVADEPSDNTETNDQNDGGDQETGESEDEEETEVQSDNSQEEDEDSLDDEDDESELEPNDNDESDTNVDTDEDATDGDDNDKSDESEDDSQTNDGNDGENQDSEEDDYKAKYEVIIAEKEKLQSFYDKVTSEFVANGRKVKGFDDPDKIIQSQQMSANYSEKMAALKPYRPLMKPLKEKGFLDDPSKLDFAIQLLDGDVEAIKKHLKDLEVDPFELDMDNVEYKQKQYTASDIDVAVDELFDEAGRIGIDDKLQEAFSKDWDNESIVTILSDSEYKNDLLDHMTSGAYDLVQDKIADIKRYDRRFASMSKIDQYKMAVEEINKEVSKENESNKDPVPEKIIEKNIVADEKETENVDQYKERVKKNQKASEARKKAASVSKRKVGKKAVKKSFDPDELDDDEFEKLIKGFM